MAPYIAEATSCLLAGELIEHIDNAVVNFSFPVGPFNLLDEVGIDVVTKIMPVLGERFPVPSELNIILEDDKRDAKMAVDFIFMVKVIGHGVKNGVKSTQPFYELLNIQPKTILSEKEIVQRCIMLM